MQTDDLIVEVRDRNLARVGQLTATDLGDLVVVPRVNDVGSWEIVLPAVYLDDYGVEVEHDLCKRLREDGAGMIVTGPQGVIVSGPMTEAKFSATAEDPSGEWTITGVSDEIVLADALAFPSPEIAAPTAQTRANDTRTGKAETILRDFVRLNIGQSAPTGRRTGFASKLSVTTDQGAGPTLTFSPRFQNLLELAREIAAQGSLVFKVVQVGATLEFRVSTPRDRTRLVSLDVANEQLESVGFGLGAPTLTRPIVAGQGEGTERQIVVRTSPDSLATEATWGRRIERSPPPPNGNDGADRAQAGDGELLAGGETITSISIEPSADLTDTFGLDWRLGDLVSAVVGSASIPVPVVEAVLKVADEGVLVGMTLGDPTGFEPEDLQHSRATSTESRVSALERTAEPVRDSWVGLVDPLWTSGKPSVTLYDTDGTTVVGTVSAFLPANDRDVQPGSLVTLARIAAGAYVITAGYSTGQSTLRQITVPTANGWVGYDDTTGLNGNSWTDPATRYTPYQSPLLATKSSAGIVVLDGFLGSTGSANLTAGAVVANLPIGYRPESRSRFQVMQSGNTRQTVDILPNGQIIAMEANAGASAPANAWMTLQNIAFPAAGVLTWNPVVPIAPWAVWDTPTWGPALYAKDAHGRVWLRGMLYGGTPNSPAWTAPVGYRVDPSLGGTTSTQVHFVTGGSGADFGYANVASGGAWTPRISTYSALTGGSYDTAGLNWVPLLRGGFANTWQNYASPFPTLGYAVRPDGLVVLRGLVGAGSIGSGIATLPPGVRPKHTLLRAGVASEALARIDIAATGLITATAGSNGWFSLDGIVFAPQQ